MPTKHSEPSRIRTGFEEVIAHRTNPPFAYSAEEDGVIESIKEGVMTVFYPKSNKKVAVQWGEDYTNNGGGGFYCTQSITINDLKVGDKVKRGDILAYNNQFFTPDPYSKQVTWNIGALTNTVIIDSNDTFEDSSVISTRLADKLEIQPVFVKEVVLKNNTTIHKFADVGTRISSVDPVIIFDQSEMEEDMFGKLDDEAIEMLAKLNKKAARAGHNGKVVRLDAFYKSTIEELSPSLKALLDLINKRKRAIKNAASGTVNQDKFKGPTNIVMSDRIGGTDLDNETVILRFYIQDTTEMGGGDKLEFDSSLKSICTAVEEPWEVEDGSVVCDAWFSAMGINNRLILSPMITGIGNRCLEAMENEIIKMYFDK